MKSGKGKVVTPKTWNRVERQKEKILTQAEEIQRQKQRIAELMETKELEWKDSRWNTLCIWIK